MRRGREGWGLVRFLSLSCSLGKTADGTGAHAVALRSCRGTGGHFLVLVTERGGALTFAARRYEGGCGMSVDGEARQLKDEE
ncbi:hypothetical protein GCM10010383_54700 [Streptomyces lomondensis]|uniref:Secreted protein n=1 Tax=Streptomyces lomondensis TaxID=68229 RepID=A0ABQ2XIC0_9ACTN|nr:hypothetical protein GCM10010383_54700 [Streptomyces lomondensis]